MNIFRHEFNAKLRSVLTWSLSLLALLFLFMSLFSSFSVDAALLNEAMSQMPEELLIAFGMDQLDLSSVIGFYSMVFLFIQICLAIQAANYGFGLVSVEESELTADFLLAKPVGRETILTAKLFAAVSAMLITDIAVWAGTLVTFSLFTEGRPYDSEILFLLLASIVMFQLFFFAVGTVVSLLMRRVRSVTSLAMALGFGMYVLSAFSGMLGEDSFDVLTPFKHFEAGQIIRDGAYDLPFLALNISITLVSIAASYWLYARRDINTAA